MYVTFSRAILMKVVFHTPWKCLYYSMKAFDIHLQLTTSTTLIGLFNVSACPHVYWRPIKNLGINYHN